MQSSGSNCGENQRPAPEDLSICEGWHGKSRSDKNDELKLWRHLKNNNKTFKSILKHVGSQGSDFKTHVQAFILPTNMASKCSLPLLERSTWWRSAVWGGGFQTG